MSIEVLRNYAFSFAIAFFVVFLVNVLVGKISMEFLNYQLPLGFDGVVEFLVMCAACVFFVIGILLSESLTKK